MVDPAKPAMSAVAALTDALVAVLRADAGIASLVGGNVYDRVPPNTVPPWIYLGPAGTRRMANDCYRAWEITARIFCVTTDFGRDLAWAIAEAVDVALDNTMPELAPGYTLGAHLVMAASGDIVDPTKPQSIFTDVVAIVYRDVLLRED